VEGLDDIGRELGVRPGRWDLRKHQRAHGPFERRRDLLRLVRHGEAGKLYILLALCDVRLQQSGQHADERRLACAVLAEHDDDLGVAELAGHNLEEELGRAWLAFEKLPTGVKGG
jgi:hypothetical protein